MTNDELTNCENLDEEQISEDSPVEDGTAAIDLDPGQEVPGESDDACEDCSEDEDEEEEEDDEEI